jgi:hypothetical protein
MGGAIEEVVPHELQAGNDSAWEPVNHALRIAKNKSRHR